MEHVDADESAADAARHHFRREGIPTLAPDERIAPILLPGERLFAVRQRALLDRRTPPPRADAPGPSLPGGDGPPGICGDLYVTSLRLVLLGPGALSFELAAIEDGLVATDRLLLVLRDGRGIALTVDRPRLLWVEIAAARAEGRTVMRAGTPDQPATR